MHVITELGLERCQDTIIEGPFVKGISGDWIQQQRFKLFRCYIALLSSLYSGKASEAMVYFSSIGCSPLIAMNPAEFLIDLANGNMKDKLVPSELEDKLLAGSQKVEAKDGRPSPVDVQVHEEGLKERHHECLSTVRVTQVISTAIIVGLLWWHSDASTPKRLQDQARHTLTAPIPIFT
ncbi:hypothetical protein ACSBR2_001148 [Camellia fascicularis]